MPRASNPKRMPNVPQQKSSCVKADVGLAGRPCEIWAMLFHTILAHHSVPGTEGGSLKEAAVLLCCVVLPASVVSWPCAVPCAFGQLPCGPEDMRGRLAS